MKEDLNRSLRVVLHELVRSDLKIFDFMQENSSGGIWFGISENNNQEWFNDSFCKSLGIDSKTSNFANRKNFISSNDLQQENTLISKAFESNKERVNYLTKYNHSNGSIVLLQCESLLIRKEDICYILTRCIHHNNTPQLNEDLKEIFNLSNDLIAISNFDNKFELLNPQWETVLGYSLDELYSKTFLEFIHPDDLERTRKEAEALTKGKALTIRFENRYIKKDGGHVWLEWNSVIDYKIKKNFSVARDITEPKIREFAQRKHTTSLLHLSREGILEQEDIGTYIRKILQEAHKILGVNRISFWKYHTTNDAIECIYFYDGVNLLKTQGEILYKEDFPRYFNAITGSRNLAVYDAANDARTVEFKESYLKEHNIKSMLDVRVMNGSSQLGVICAETTNNYKHWSFEEQSYISSIADLISTTYTLQQKNIFANALDKSEALFQSLVSILPYAIYRVDAEGKITFFNEVYQEYLQRDSKDILGKTSHDLFPKHLADKYAKDDQTVMESGQVLVTIEENTPLNSNDAKFVEVTKIPIYNITGEIEGIQAIFRDVTKVKEDDNLKNQLLKELKTKNSTLLETQDYLKSINEFSYNILSKNTLEEIVWEIARNVIQKFNFIDCVIYLVDDKHEYLEQVAAYGSKMLDFQTIKNPIKIPVDKGIVGSAYTTAKPVLVKDTSKDARYIVDIDTRFSELAVPIIVDNKVIGVVDSEHDERDFFTNDHVETLSTISRLVAMRIDHAQSIKKHQNIERELRQSKELYESILSAIGEGLVVQDLNDTIIMANHSASKILDLSPEQLRGKDSYDPRWRSTNEKGVALKPEEHPSMVTLNTGKGVDNFIMNIYAGEELRKYISINSRPVFDHNKKMYASVASFTDITERVTTEAALKASEEKFRTLFKNLPIGVLLYDKDFIVQEWNPQAIEILDMDENILKNYKMNSIKWDAITEDGKIINTEQFPPFIAFKHKKTVTDFIMGVRRNPAKDYLWIKASATPMFNDMGEVIQIISTFEDISESKRAENEIKKLANIAERTADIILTCDEDGNVTWANSALTKVLGYIPEEVIGYKPGERTSGEETDPNIIKALHEALKEHLMFNATVKAVTKTKKQCWINYEVTPINDEQGKFLYSIVTKRDITDLIEKQIELEHVLKSTISQNKRLKEYSYITSHNIRSSVSNLLGLTEIIMDDPKNLEFIYMLHETTKKLDQTINNINKLLHLEEKSIKKHKTQCNVLEALTRLIELNKTVIDDHKVEMILNVPADLNLLTVPAYLDSILHNLITNAIKYGTTPYSKKIEVTAKHDHKEIVIIVRDYGLGLDIEKYKDKIFKLGTRFHSNKSDGQGLGLFMTKRQIDVLGGKIEIESELGKGSVFKVYFKIDD
ncbi:MAG: hypothetical protein CMO01_01845 [Thalassobius sp.]|nr:hypothetical protein [Thalassovita sp.]